MGVDSSNGAASHVAHVVHTRLNRTQPNCLQPLQVTEESQEIHLIIGWAGLNQVSSQWYTLQGETWRTGTGAAIHSISLIEVRAEQLHVAARGQSISARNQDQDAQHDRHMLQGHLQGGKRPYRKDLISICKGHAPQLDVGTGSDVATAGALQVGNRVTEPPQLTC